MKNKGFTLIELLAVIILLSIVALIAVPTVVTLMDNARKNALKDSAQGLIRSAQYYNSNRKLTGKNLEEVVFEGTEYKNGNEKLEFNGERFPGKVIISADGQISLAIYSDNYCVYKKKDEANVTLEKVNSTECLEKI